MNNIQFFNKLPFISAVRQLFKELEVPVNYIDDKPAKASDILGDLYNIKNESHALIEDIYPFGLVDDNAFKGKESSLKNIEQIKSIVKDYDALLLIGITLKKRNNNVVPSRTQLADITRAFNRAFIHTPVTILFRYGNNIAIANTERLPYKHEWREGEKIGKISLLKDIDILNLHRGHLAIIQQMSISTSGNNAISSFKQLYYYWQSVFSISVLNKSFYQEIIMWFNKAVKDIKIPETTAGSEKHKDFTVRLIARFIFIWFLKELKVVKEELLITKWPNGLNNDLINPKAKGSAYYKFILQNLFFNALNCEQKDREKNAFSIYSSDFKDIAGINELIQFAPYLNGGLFDIHPNDWCDTKVNNAFQVPDHLFLDVEEGLNSVLAQYKFTIAENTPLEEEIAVDPEMLGRIFENLLAEQSDDTKEAARSNTGAFYTPRPVVAYMCRNTLLKHLNIEVKKENGKQIVSKLLNTKVLDPACGSGAYPMGMLEEMMQVLETVDPDGNIWVSEMLKSKDGHFLEHISDFIADKQIRYVKKLGLLRNCLFGIDILEYAIEITKLRCWLSLIVEQKVDFSKPNYNLKPLPNLDFKFYKKNTLFRKYKGENLNELIESVDKDGLLEELDNLENEYFISSSNRFGTKEEIKEKILRLLERIIDAESKQINKAFNSATNTVNYIKTNKGSDKELRSAEKKVKDLAQQLSELADFKDKIKDYFIERVVFPGIFSKKLTDPGFDILIGNPPYVNTKLISKMGITDKLREEYDYCDDLYNHFTIRGFELLKKGGLLSYITSDTFLTLQSKENIRRAFLGIGESKKSGDLFNATDQITETRLLEIVNTPKAFAALVDTAIFTVQKESFTNNYVIDYIDIRYPNAEAFSISEEEWKQIKSSKENISGWERVLNKTFSALTAKNAQWIPSHYCDGEQVSKDKNSHLLKYRLKPFVYTKAINYSIFAPTPYNSQILEKIIKPARPVFDKWWDKIQTSRNIETNRAEIISYCAALKSGSSTLIGLLADGGQGLATGNNGNYVGYKEGNKLAERCVQTRPIKLLGAINEEPKIKKQFKELSQCETVADIVDVFDGMSEPEIWNLFDQIKGKYGLRIFGKGYMYRIIPDNFIFDVTEITEKQKKNGIKGKKSWVPYDKGDKEGNRWYLETPYLINWSEESVLWLTSNSGKSGAGMPVVRNPQFYFRNGLCWSDVLNPNSKYIKCRLKSKTVNDVKSMSLYESAGFGDEYLVTSLNSFLFFKILREFFNSTVAIQLNDIKKLPILIPSKSELSDFKNKFNQCLKIKKKYFDGKLDKKEADSQLKPIEVEIDDMVNKLYGIDTNVAKEAEKLIEEFVEVNELIEVDEIEDTDD